MESEKLIPNNHHHSTEIDDGGIDEEGIERFSINRQQISLMPTYKSLLLTFGLLLFLTNAGWYWIYRQVTGTPASHERLGMLGEPEELIYYLEDADPKHVLLPFEHDWEDLQAIEVDGYRYADIHWEPHAWNPAGGPTVAVSEEMQRSLHLHPDAALTSENTSSYHYMVAGYHQLHCLHVVRDSIYYLNGTLTEWHGEGGFLWDHVLHCIEAVRQALQCSLDPTLIPLQNSWPGIPNGQLHVCRNSEALRRWTAKHSYPKPEFTRQQEQPHTHEWIERQKLSS